jgi:hypothetical protein
MTSEQHEILVRAERHVRSPRENEEDLADWLHRSHDKDVLAVHLSYLLEHMEEHIRCQILTSLQECQSSKEPKVRELLAECLYSADLID